MSTHELVIELPQISCIDGVCQGCALRKHHKDSFLVGRSICTKAPLDLIHNDLMSFPTLSFLGS